MFDILFALAILTSDGPVSDAEIAIFRPAILAVAESAEISDVRERAYLFVDPQQAVAVLRERWVTFAGAPRLAESSRFPDLQFIRDRCAINRHRRAWLVRLGEVNSLYREQADAEIGWLDRE